MMMSLLHVEAAIVEFYDIRSGHMLLAASQGTAVPWVWQQLALSIAMKRSREPCVDGEQNAGHQC